MCALPDQKVEFIFNGLIINKLNNFLINLYELTY